jgi:hypothetical protein
VVGAPNRAGSGGAAEGESDGMATARGGAEASGLVRSSTTRALAEGVTPVAAGGRDACKPLAASVSTAKAAGVAEAGKLEAGARLGASLSSVVVPEAGTRVAARLTGAGTLVAAALSPAEVLAAVRRKRFPWNWNLQCSHSELHGTR